MEYDKEESEDNLGKKEQVNCAVLMTFSLNCSHNTQQKSQLWDNLMDTGTPLVLDCF